MAVSLQFTATVALDGLTVTDLAGAVNNPTEQRFEDIQATAGLFDLWSFAQLGPADVFFWTIAIPGVGAGNTAQVEVVFPNGQRQVAPGFEQNGTFYVENLVVPQGARLAISLVDGVGAPQPGSFQFWAQSMGSSTYADLTCCHRFSPFGPVSMHAVSECCFVYRPGEPNPSGNVYADWAMLVAAVAAVRGYKTITVDTELVDPAPIPAGAWDMNQAVFYGATDAISNRELRAADGATLARVGGFLGEVGLLSDSTAPVISLATGQVLFLGRGAEINAQDVASGVAIISMDNGSRLIMDGHARLRANEDDPVVVVVGGATAQIQLEGGSGIDDHALTGAGDYNVNSMGADCDIGQTQPAHAGVLSITFLDPVQAALETLATGTTKRSGAVLATGDLSLPLAAEAAGPVWIRNDRSGPAGPVDITPSGADTIDGAATLRIRPRGCVLLKSDGVATWSAVCGRRFQTFSFQSPLVTLVLGTDLFFGFNMAGIAGSIDVAGTIGLGSQFLVPSAGDVARVCLRSSVAIAAGDTIEVRGRVNGGAWVVLGTIVGAVGAGVVTILEVPAGTLLFADADEIELSLRQTLGVGIILTALNATVDLIFAP